MENFANHVSKQQGRNIRLEPMTGSAGGIAGAFLGLLGAQLVHGSRFLLDWVQFDRQLEKCEAVITGEGKTDSQTLQGKAPLECIDRAIRLKKKSILLSGAFGPGWELIRNKPYLLGCYASGREPNPSKALFEKAKEIFSQEKMISQLSQGYYEESEKTSEGNVLETTP
jgi:glycerate kinase